MSMMSRDPDELRAALEHAKGTMLRIDVEYRTYGRPRYIVRDVAGGGRIIRRFRPHQIGNEVKRWIMERFPDGVWVEGRHEKLLLWSHRVWGEALIEHILRRNV